MLFKSSSIFKSIAIPKSASGTVWSTVAITLLVAFFGTSAQAQLVSQPMPPALTGMWQVTAVHIDSGTSRTLNYQQNDRRLVGRIFWISPEKITVNTPEMDGCEAPRVSMQIHKLDRLIQESMAGRSPAPEQPTAADYGLSRSKNGAPEVFTFQCKNRLWGASLGREDGIQGVWGLKLDEKRLAIRWYDETILELSGIPPNTRPKASYDCHLTRSPAEKAICSSVALALLDVSIADAYTAALDRFSKEPDLPQRQALKVEQRSWLLQRNKCGSDAGCLQQAMSTRLDALVTIH